MHMSMYNLYADVGALVTKTCRPIFFLQSLKCNNIIVQLNRVNCTGIIRILSRYSSFYSQSQHNLCPTQGLIAPSDKVLYIYGMYCKCGAIYFNPIVPYENTGRSENTDSYTTQYNF